MAITLQKGQTISLEKDQFDLSSVTIGLGWDVKPPEPKGFFGSIFGSGGNSDEEYDLDAIAFLLDENGKVKNLGNQLVGGDVIFFNNLKHPSGAIWLTGDNRTGAGEEGADDEQIIVQLNRLSESYQRILFLVSIYKGSEKNQHFGRVNNAYIRAVDAKGKEIARYSLSTDDSFNQMRSVIFAEVYRKDGAWKCRAIGEPKSTDSFVDLLRPLVY